MTQRHVRLGSLAATLVDSLPAGAAPARRLIILAHGFGAPGTDLVSLAGALTTLEPTLSTACFAFPAAPIDLAPLGMPGGRAWFPIDFQALDAAARSGRVDLYAKETPAGMAEAVRALRGAVEALMRELQLGWSDVVLGGFSQGAMVALELALAAEEAPGGLILWSPTLVAAARTQERAERRTRLPVFIAHGRQDPILPFAATEELVTRLRNAGLSVEFHAFDGPHTIPQAALVRAAERLVAWAP